MTKQKRKKKSKTKNNNSKGILSTVTPMLQMSQRQQNKKPGRAVSFTEWWLRNSCTCLVCFQVNLRHGLRHGVARTGHERDTCTSCAGTMILEFAALSRLSGEPIFEVRDSLS